MERLTKELRSKKEKKLNTISQPTNNRKKARLEFKTRNGARTGRRQWRDGTGRNPTPHPQPPSYPQPLIPPKTPSPLLQTPSLQTQPPHFQPPPPPSLLNITLADLFAGLQRQATIPFQPQQSASCTPVSVRPPPLVHPGGKVGSGRPPQLSQPFQQDFRHRDRLAE